jgi:hypothetical protein
MHQIGFQEQGVLLGRGDDIIQVRRPLQKVLQQGVVFFLKVLADPFFQVDRLADIKDFPGRGLKNVDPRFFREIFFIFQQLKSLIANSKIC